MPRTDTPRLCRVAGRTAWHIYHQRRRLSTGCESRVEAETALARYIEGGNRPKGATKSISGLLALYLADRKEENIPGYERLEWAHKPLVRFWREKPVEVISKATCRDYLRARVRDGVVPGTVRTELQAIRAALNWAKKAGHIEAVPEIIMPGRPPPRDRWLTRDEADSLISACRSPHIRLFVLIALHTAARKGAILELAWHRIDMERRLIDFTTGTTKTRKGRARVPVNDTLLAALMKAKPLAETEFVIEYAGGAVASVKHGFHDACVRAGLQDVTPHTLRHTAATWMAQAGIPLWDIAGFLGHSSPQMVADTYGHHHPDFLKTASRALG